MKREKELSYKTLKKLINPYSSSGGGWEKVLGENANSLWAMFKEQARTEIMFKKFWNSLAVDKIRLLRLCRISSFFNNVTDLIHLAEMKASELNMPLKETTLFATCLFFIIDGI